MRSLRSDRNLFAAACIGPLIVVGAAGGLARACGSEIGLLPLAIVMLLTSLTGLVVWRGAYTKQSSAADVF